MRIKNTSCLITFPSVPTILCSISIHMGRWQEVGRNADCTTNAWFVVSLMVLRWQDRRAVILKFQSWLKVFISNPFKKTEER